MRYAVLLIAVCGVASAALLARYGLHAGVSPVQLSAWRLIVASLALIAFQLSQKCLGRPAPEPALGKADIARTAIAGLFLALHFGTWIASLQYVTVARSTLMVATSPLWAGLLGLIVPSLKPQRSFWMGLAVAAAGTFIVTTQGGSLAGTAGDKAWIGDLLAAAGAICIVPYLILSQQVQTRAGTLRTITWIYSSAAACLVIYLAATQKLEIPSSQDAWLSILGMAFFAQLLGHSLFNLSLKSFTAAQVTTATLLEPVFAAALAWMFLAEPITWQQAIGGAILLMGVAVTLKPPHPPVTSSGDTQPPGTTTGVHGRAANRKSKIQNPKSKGFPQTR